MSTIDQWYNFDRRVNQYYYWDNSVKVQVDSGSGPQDKTFKLSDIVPGRGKLRSPPKVYDLEFYSANLKLLALIRLLWKNTQKC